MTYEPLMGIENEFLYKKREGKNWNVISDFSDNFEKYQGIGSLYGGRIYIDGAVSPEINTPLIEIEKGSAERAVKILQAQRKVLYGLNEYSDCEFFGDNMHYNFSVPNNPEEIIYFVAKAFCVPYMLLLEDRNSRGICFDFRASRLEIRAEHIDRTNYLTGVLAFLIASTQFVIDHYKSDDSYNSLPFIVESRLDHDVAHPNMLGEPILQRGRKTIVPVKSGKLSYCLTAQDVLETYLHHLSDYLDKLCNSNEREQLERIVKGDLPLNLEIKYGKTKHKLSKLKTGRPKLKGFAKMFSDIREGKLLKNEGFNFTISDWNEIYVECPNSTELFLDMFELKDFIDHGYKEYMIVERPIESEQIDSILPIQESIEIRSPVENKPTKTSLESVYSFPDSTHSTVFEYLRRSIGSIIF